MSRRPPAPSPPRAPRAGRRGSLHRVVGTQPCTPFVRRSFDARLDSPNRTEPHRRMRQYLDLMERVLSKGVEKRAIFCHQMCFDLQSCFPLLTTKKLHVKSIVYELLWFLRGDTDIKYL